MASPITSPGHFVLEIASLGQDVVTSFIKFITTRKIQERELENILVTISITTSILLDLESTINKYEQEVYVEDEVARPTCETCKADLEKLLIISKEAGGRGIWVREATLDRSPQRLSYGFFSIWALVSTVANLQYITYLKLQTLLLSQMLLSTRSSRY